MASQLLQWAAAIYLGAGLLAGLGLALENRRLDRGSVVLLAIGALIHAISFSVLHRADPPPPLNELPAAISFMAWIGALAYLVLMRRLRLQRLLVLVAPAVFLGAFVGALRMPAQGLPVPTASASWSHAHVLLASAGLSLLGLAGLAGAIFLVEHRRLKLKLPIERWIPFPSLEALNRVNAASLSVGFLLLTLGVITGMIWVQSVEGKPWTGTAHEVWSLVAWVIYCVLIVARFAAKQGSRNSAVSAVYGFLFLLFAVVGLEFFV